MSAPSPAQSVFEPEKYRLPITRYISYLLHNGAEADDLTQETLLRAFQQQNKLRDAALLEGWIYRIATLIMFLAPALHLILPQPNIRL